MIKSIRWKLAKFLNKMVWKLIPEPAKTSMTTAWETLGPEWLRICIKLQDVSK